MTKIPVREILKYGAARAFIIGKFMTDDRPGFWEDARNGGYHMRGDPWLVSDKHPQGQRHGKD